MLYIPSWDQWMTVDGIATLIFVFVAPFFFLAESKQLFNFGYSKFADPEGRFQLPSRLGMFLLYAPAALLYPVIHFAWGIDAHATSTWHLIAMTLVTAHFTKRCLEVLFLHRFSGTTNLFSTVMISGLYATVSILLSAIAIFRLAPGQQPPGFHNQAIEGIGIAIWAIGSLGNLYHHWLLRNLRKPGETGYVLPRGGLFGWVCCPHYLFELTAWWGFAIFFHHAGAYILAYTMSCYLFGRAHTTLKWYHQKNLAPDGWKRILPFIY